MAMTLAEAGMYFDYASHNPTVRGMVAAYLGVRPKKKKPDDMNDLLSLFGGAGVIR